MAKNVYGKINKRKKPIHLKASNYISECGYFTDNLTTDKAEVTCKHCLQIMNKQHNK